jgi:hypothetical protein
MELIDDEESHTLLPSKNARPLKLQKTPDLLMKRLWWKNPWRMCVIESMALAGACVALAEE